MATTDFTNGVTLSDAGWADDVDCSAYSVFSSVTGTNTIVATGPATYTYSSTRPAVFFTPAFNNSGATTINITPSGSAALGARNIFSNGAACTGGELVANIPTILIDDGTRFHILGRGLRHVVVQRLYQEYTANAGLTTALPADGTIPQNTEGTEIMTQAITPKSASNRIRIRFQAVGSNNTAGTVISASLFVDSTANALQTTGAHIVTENFLVALVFEYEVSAGSTTARTYKIRVGPSSNTMRLNGNTAGTAYGGTERATMIVEEVS